MYRVSDASQNSAPSLATVTVPHDQGTGPEPLLMHLEANGLPDMARISWPALPGLLAYDVIAADLTEVSITNGHLYLSSARVLARGTSGTAYVEDGDGIVPSAGRAIIYLVQQRTSDGGAGYGTASAPWPREPLSCDGGRP